MHTPSPVSRRILSTRELVTVTGLSSTTLWRLRGRGELPAPIRLSAGRVGWRVEDVEAWISARATDSRPAESR